MNIIKRLLTVLLILLVLCGCTGQKPTVDSKNDEYNLVEKKENLTGKDCIEFLKNYTVRKKNIKNNTDNEEFNKYLDECFAEVMESDYLNMHYNVMDYKKYGIEKPELTVGVCEYVEEADVSELLEDLKELHSFKFDSLSYKQQYEYEATEYSLMEDIAYAFYEKYDQIYTSKTDILSTIVTNFDEFVFYDEETIEDYFVLLEDVDRYLDDTLTYTAKQAANGLYLEDYSIDYVQDYIDSFISKVDDNALILSFNNRIENVDIVDASKKNEYIKKNEEIIKNEIIPAFDEVSKELNEYRGETKSEDVALSNINAEFAELNYMLATSNNISVAEMYENAKEMFDDYLALFNTALDNQYAINEYLDCYDGLIEPLGGTYEEILKFLEDNCSMSYPNKGKIEYEISNLDESAASDSIVAYYISPPVDKPNANVIRVNPNASSEDMCEDYFTLAHEGIPGHMYQNDYMVKNGISNYRLQQSFIGCIEGYACYSQNEAMDFLGLSDDAKAIMFVQEFGAYILESVIDLGVNCMNWTAEDVETYLTECGYVVQDVDLFYADAVDRSGTLCSYGIGYLNHMTLKNYAMEQLGDKFNIVAYNEAILKNGNLPFCILKGAVEEYIEANR